MACGFRIALIAFTQPGIIFEVDFPGPGDCSRGLRVGWRRSTISGLADPGKVREFTDEFQDLG